MTPRVSQVSVEASCTITTGGKSRKCRALTYVIGSTESNGYSFASAHAARTALATSA